MTTIKAVMLQYNISEAEAIQKIERIKELTKEQEKSIKATGFFKNSKVLFQN